MINFENYERMTIKNAGKYTQIKSTVSTSDCLKRLAELEDKIEKGLLVPRYSILKDWQYDWWCVCEVDEQSRIIAQCKTEEEAKQKLKKLTESDTE
jgi:hypothetical protein|nr:MAG TPA: hypothetical protein [Caudoviricetes sp.]